RGPVGPAPRGDAPGQEVARGPAALRRARRARASVTPRGARRLAARRGLRRDRRRRPAGLGDLALATSRTVPTRPCGAALGWAHGDSAGPQRAQPRPTRGA